MILALSHSTALLESPDRRNFAEPSVVAWRRPKPPSGPFRQSLAYRAERAVSDFVLLSEPAAAVVALGHLKIVVQTLIAPAHDHRESLLWIVSGTRTCAHL